MPLLRYVASVIHTLDIVFKEVKTIIQDFIWDCKPSKIAYNTLIQPICKGGLKLMDYETKVKSLKAIWVKRFLESSASKWKAVPCYFYKTTDIYFFFSANQPKIKIKPKFYQDIQNYWSEARTVDNTNIKVEMIQEQVIWNNKYITIAKCPFYWKR